jgi:hypothetical protein
MSLPDVQLMSAGELVAEFRKLAPQLGNAWNFEVKPERYERTPERAALLARMNLVTDEMRRRTPADALGALMKDPDVDVRGLSAGRFSQIDKDLARAAYASLSERVSTQQAFEQIARARTPPPSRPTLTEMNVNDLLARFVDACNRQYWTRHTSSDGSAWDTELCNRITRELAAIKKEIAGRGALERLLPFLDASNITLRLSAAAGLLDLAPERALRVLQDISASKFQPDSSDAFIALTVHRGKQRR